MGQWDKELTSALYKRAYEDFNFEFEDHKPLTRAILQRESNCKLPNLGQKYNCIMDPSDHVVNYHTVIQLQGTNNNILYRVFFITLEKGVRS